MRSKDARRKRVHVREPISHKGLGVRNTDLARSFYVGSLHVDIHLVAAGFNESMPLVEVLRSIQSKGVETNWFSEQVGVSQLSNQEARTNATVLELGKDKQFVQEYVIIMLR
ncbi:MAG TPA: hypothetical protein VEH53_02750 [archaeon]|nr:hypothetical protein [archaeon]